MISFSRKQEAYAPIELVLIFRRNKRIHQWLAEYRVQHLLCHCANHIRSREIPYIRPVQAHPNSFDNQLQPAGKYDCHQ